MSPTEDPTRTEAPISLANAFEMGALNVFVAAATCIVCGVGISTNTLLLVAYFKHPQLKGPTNLLLVNQGFADLFSCCFAAFYSLLNNTALGLQLTSQHKYLCLSTLCGTALAVWASLFCLLTLSVDRMMSIAFPFVHIRVMEETVVKHFIICLWFFMIFVLSLPVFGLHSWTPGHICSAFYVFSRSYFVNFFLLSSFVVLIVVAFLNLVIWAIAVSKRCVHPDGQQQQQQSKSEYKLTKMFLIVVGVFYACWLPYALANSIALLGASTLFTRGFASWFLGFLEVIEIPFCVNSALNPLIYAWKSSAFRRAFAKTLGFQLPESNQHSPPI
jgi:hypothetical protein